MASARFHVNTPHRRTTISLPMAMIDLARACMGGDPSDEEARQWIQEIGERKCRSIHRHEAPLSGLVQREIAWQAEELIQRLRRGKRG